MGFGAGMGFGMGGSGGVIGGKPQPGPSASSSWGLGRGGITNSQWVGQPENFNIGDEPVRLNLRTRPEALTGSQPLLPGPAATEEVIAPPTPSGSSIPSVACCPPTPSAPSKPSASKPSHLPNANASAATLTPFGKGRSEASDWRLATGRRQRMTNSRGERRFALKTSERQM
jgi:hypothetical protein